MKKTFLFLATVFLYLMPIHATNNVVVNNVTISQGGTGTISVVLNNDKNYTAFSLKLTLPEGVTYTGVAKGTRMAENHSLSGNGTTGMITCLSTGNTPFTGTSGELFTITVSVSNGATIGTSLDATLTEVNFSTTSAEESLDDVEFSITIGEPSDGRTVLDETSTDAPEASSGAVNVRVKRSINADTWSTICLPFAMTATQVTDAFGDDVELGNFIDYETIDDVDDNTIGLTVNFADATAIEANHPYIIKVSDAISEFTVDGVTIHPEDNPCVEYDNGKTGTKRQVYGTFQGTYVADFNFYQNALNEGCKALFLNGNKFYYATSSTKRMKAFRAYFYFEDHLAELDEASARIIMSFDNESTKIDMRTMEPIATGKAYNMAGQYVGEVEATDRLPKGVYIIDGKKKVIK